MVGSELSKTSAKKNHAFKLMIQLKPRFRILKLLQHKMQYRFDGRKLEWSVTTEQRSEGKYDWKSATSKNLELLLQ